MPFIVLPEGDGPLLFATVFEAIDLHDESHRLQLLLMMQGGLDDVADKVHDMGKLAERYADTGLAVDYEEGGVLYNWMADKDEALGPDAALPEAVHSFAIRFSRIMNLLRERLN